MSDFSYHRCTEMISPEALEPKYDEGDKYIDGQPEIRAHKTVRGRSPAMKNRVIRTCPLKGRVII